ncbi:Uncharacterised protein [Kluyvera cryocrescens]|uniref:Uncharacterized protein n=1 Tax=Kluyvera cryocrescens TaxID=580 RepID=A0A485AJK8_KLUCR|nr:Uncharacterised protein [Kluyvera cryocrescens]
MRNYATEASSMSRNQLLAQTSMSMLKQSNSMSRHGECPLLG